MTLIDLGITWKEILYLTFMAGVVWFELKAIRRDISRLDKKVEKHNNFDRRIIRLETMVEVKEHQINAQQMGRDDKGL